MSPSCPCRHLHPVPKTATRRYGAAWLPTTTCRRRALPVGQRSLVAEAPRPRRGRDRRSPRGIWHMWDQVTRAPCPPHAPPPRRRRVRHAKAACRRPVANRSERRSASPCRRRSDTPPGTLTGRLLGGEGTNRPTTAAHLDPPSAGSIGAAVSASGADLAGWRPQRRATLAVYSRRAPQTAAATLISHFLAVDEELALSVAAMTRSRRSRAETEQQTHRRDPPCRSLTPPRTPRSADRSSPCRATSCRASRPSAEAERRRGGHDALADERERPPCSRRGEESTCESTTSAGITVFFLPTLQPSRHSRTSRKRLALDHLAPHRLADPAARRLDDAPSPRRLDRLHRQLLGRRPRLLLLHHRRRRRGDSQSRLRRPRRRRRDGAA